jgi:flagellum-specific ATP synthase
VGNFLETDKLEFLPNIDLNSYLRRLKNLEPLKATKTGFVKTVLTPMLIEVKLPDSTIGEICFIQSKDKTQIPCQVVGFNDENVFITPFSSLNGVGPSSRVISYGDRLTVPVGDKVLGKVLDCFGQSIEGLKIDTDRNYPLHSKTINPLSRKRIKTQLEVGIKSVDIFMPIGEGQRLGIFSTAGQGKSSLMGMLAKFSTSDVNVIALIGERGREVLDFLEDNLGPEGIAKSVVIVATSDEMPMRRIVAAYTATAIAEYFRDQGKKVLFLMDSITRFARALREIALSLGEPPARQGYPPSVFSSIPELLERAGKTEAGSITAFYSILLSSEKLEDPLAEEVRAILDGHIYLSSKFSQIGHFPAIDILQSNSRLQNSICEPEHLNIAVKIRRLLAVYEENYDLINLGAYRSGSDPILDEAIIKRSKILALLAQNPNEKFSLGESLELAKKLID